MVLVAVAGMAAPPALAGAQHCLETNPSYMDACGPTFSVPTWTDAGGWTDPSQYSTIQLADVNGDGKSELLGRGDAGLQIWWFDTDFGQWRPQVDPDAVPQILSDFSSPRPGTNRANDWTKPYYYSTIQTADIDGQPGAEVLARFSDGMRVYKYLPPSGGNAIDGGTWKRIGTAGPFSDAEDYGNVTLYPTIHVLQPTADGPAVLYARRHSNPGEPSLSFYAWENGGWTQLTGPAWAISGFSDRECGQPSCYLTLQTARLRRPGFLEEVMGRNAAGVSAFAGTLPAGWTRILGPSQPTSPTWPNQGLPVLEGGRVGGGQRRLPRQQPLLLRDPARRAGLRHEQLQPARAYERRAATALDRRHALLRRLPARRRAGGGAVPTAARSVGIDPDRQRRRRRRP